MQKLLNLVEFPQENSLDSFKNKENVSSSFKGRCNSKFGVLKSYN